eukprot:241737_1
MAATVETGSLPGLQSEREQLKIQEFEAPSDKQSEALRAETALALEYQSETKKNKSFMSHIDKKSEALQAETPPPEREQFKKSTELSSRTFEYQSVAKNNNPSTSSRSDKKSAATFPSFRKIGNKFESHVSTLRETCVCRRGVRLRTLNSMQICIIAFHLLLAGGLLYWASHELHQRLQNPSEYHYTTCFITKMRDTEGIEDEYGEAK